MDIPEPSFGVPPRAEGSVEVDVVTDLETDQHIVLVGSVEVVRYSSAMNAVVAQHAIERALDRLGLRNKGEYEHGR